MATGTGTPGSNQNGAVATGPVGSPGEILSVSGPLSINNNVPVVDKDFADLFVTTAYDLAVRDALRPNLIFDQFAEVRTSRLTHNGATKRLFFMDDLADATTPLLENIDIDKVALTGRYMEMTQREYGNAVARTALLKAQTMIPFDPVAARKVGWNAGKSMDALAQAAFTAASLAMKNPSGGTITGTVGVLAPTLSNGSAGYVSSDVIQEATVMLQEQHVEPYSEDAFVMLCGPRAVQHLRAESGTSGWRDVVINGGGGGGNSIIRGQVGWYEGVRVVVSRRLTNTALVFGREAFAKTYPGVEGFGPMPSTVIAPVTDTLRRFAGIGWHWIGGYSLFRPQAVVKITHTTSARAFGATNNAIGATAYAES